MEAVIFMGIQATGKSSFYKERFFRTHVRINLDMLKTRHRERVLLEACLEARQPFVVDNTNVTVAERAKYIEQAKLAGFRVVGFYFKSDVRAAIERNSHRIGAEYIPVIGILATSGRLQLPRRGEGFDALYYVSMSEAGVFVVEEWTDENLSIV